MTLTRPLETLAEQVRGVLEEDGAVPLVSYGVAPHVDAYAWPSVQGTPTLRAALALLRASAGVEQRLHAAMHALQDDPPEVVHVAVVYGTSLHFAQSTWIWSLHGGIPPHSHSPAHDTDACKRQRKKTVSLFERKLIRSCMAHESLHGTHRPAGRTRILLYAPPTLRLPGWTPRPHWNVALCTERPEPVQAEDAPPSEAEPPARDAPLRTSRMALSAAAMGQRAVRTSHRQPRGPRRAPPAQLWMEGGLGAGTAAAGHVWFECEAVLFGVP